jgi:Arc/MetJ-type ribon-helix-helix transcriptional regulator
MVIDLKPEQQRVIDLAVQSGAYRTPGEVVDQAFEIIREQLELEDWMLEQREAVTAHIEKGFAQAESGELIDGDAAVEVLRQRRTERLKPRDDRGFAANQFVIDIINVPRIALKAENHSSVGRQKS